MHSLDFPGFAEIFMVVLMANYLADDDNVDDHYELNLTFPYPNFVLTLCNLLTFAGVHC